MHTRRSYELAIRDLERECGRCALEVGREEIARWVAGMAGSVADSTINQRLAAVSSYLTFAEEMGVGSAPRLKALRRRVNPYGKSNYLRAEQARALLDCINRESVQGSRDYALFLMFLATGRRSAEIRQLRWGDFSTDGGRWFYRWVGKGRKGGVRECPVEVWEAIVVWLNRSGRLVHMQDEDYIFTAISRSATRLPGVLEGWLPGREPLSMQAVSQLLRRYARKAGIGGRVHIHMLRHSAAMLRKEAGDDVLIIQDFLGHSTVAVTQVYLHQLEQRLDVSWIRVREMLGVSGVLR